MAKLPNILNDVFEYYSIQYADADDNVDFHQLLTNGFDEDKLTEILNFIKQYAPEFEWVETA